MTKPRRVDVAPGVSLGAGLPFVLIAGPDCIESEELVLEVGETLKDLTTELGIPWILKASYDKANRTSVDAFRGPGLEKGIEILGRVKDKLGVPVTTDVHAVDQIEVAARVADVIQIPAFLSRQTDLLVAAGKCGRVVNVKKGQFMAPRDIVHAAAPAKALREAIGRGVEHRDPLRLVQQFQRSGVEFKHSL